MVWRLGFARLVRGGQDVGDVGGQQVVHLVAQGGLEHQLGVGGGVPHGQVEEGGSTDPVNDVTEGKGGQQVLKIKVIEFVHFMNVIVSIK